MLNRITMTGRLTADPELRKTPSDISVTSFSIANQRNYKNASGERDTDFFNIVAWRKTADFVCQYFSKGSMVTIDGRLESRKYTDKEGNNRTAIEIVADNVFFGDSKNDSENRQQNQGGGEFVPDFSAQRGTNQFDSAVEDDDLPFDSFPAFPG